MSRQRTYVYEVVCDGCGTSSGDATTAKEVIAELRESGWKIGKLDYCPDCVAKRASRTDGQARES